MALMHADTAFFGPSDIWTGQWASHQKFYDRELASQVGNPAISGGPVEPWSGRT